MVAAHKSAYSALYDGWPPIYAGQLLRYCVVFQMLQLPLLQLPVKRLPLAVQFG